MNIDLKTNFEIFKVFSIFVNYILQTDKLQIMREIFYLKYEIKKLFNFL